MRRPSHQSTVDERKTSGKNFQGSSFFNAANPRKYKGANIQFDAILNKVGYHYPQQRIVVLWEGYVRVRQRRHLRIIPAAVVWWFRQVVEKLKTHS